MSHTETSKNLAIGLDVGTSRIVSARQAGKEIRYVRDLTKEFPRQTGLWGRPGGIVRAVDRG